MEKIIVYIGCNEEKTITEEMCRALFLTRIQQSFQEYLQVLRRGQLKEAISIMYKIVENGYSIIDIFDAFFKFMKATILLTEEEKYRIIQLLCKYITIVHNMHEETIEIVLFTNNIYKWIVKEE
jgi:DNA polymerase III gamma/tau subunit